MLEWTGTQSVSSTEGWDFMSSGRYSFNYIDKKGVSFSVKSDSYYSKDGKYEGRYIFFDSLNAINSKAKISFLQRIVIKKRIKIALDFMGINFKELPGDPDEVSDYDPTQNIISRGDLVLEEIESFSSKDEFEKFELFLDKQINKGLLEKIEVSLNYSYKGRSGGLWYREDMTNKYWRLLAPEGQFKGSWEIVRKELIK